MSAGARAEYRVVPVFIAPMQSLVKGFVDDVRKQSASKRENDEVSRFLKERGRDVPIYLLYSRDYHRNDRTFFEAVLKLYDWLVQNREVLSMVEFLKDPGVIAGTASKSQVQQQLYAFDPERGCNRWFKFETLADFLAEINREGSVL
ncbi:hypothetical protein [Burkholderia pseudomallei]|uniref:hypothetical protein n=1 Tax=Burkholderia pseudomallei TaxID=28450 RepID=UPI0020C32520|nr:hypothetical protein [Burkholderia pseudomallei]